MQTLIKVDLVRSRQFLQMTEDVGPLLQAPCRQFPDHHRVRPDLPRLKEGLYTFQALVARGDQKWADDYLREFDRRLAHFHYRTEAEWRGILEASGLQVETIAPYLAAPVVYIWDRIENYFTQPVFHMMSQRKLAAFILLPRRLRWWLVHRLLSRYYRREEEPTDLYGCWLIVGRKP